MNTKTAADADAIRAHLELVLKSPEFQASKRNSGFLSYVVSKALSGETQLINGYQIGREVFGRPEDFDPQTDPIVRTQAVRLRAALKNFYHDHGDAAKIKITIPRGGYVPNFEPDQNKLAAVGGAASAAHPKEKPYPPKIAVLPFADLSPEADYQYFADGLARELAVSLSRFDHLAAISTESSKLFHQFLGDATKLGEHFGAQFLLRGSLQRYADKYRITVELIDCAENRLIWADQIRGELTMEDFFEMQDEIVSRVTSLIADDYGVIPRTLLNAPKTPQPKEFDVYDAVLEFHTYATNTAKMELREKTRKSLKQAVAKDPNYPLTWAYLAEVTADDYTIMHNNAGVERVIRAQQYANRALEIDPRCQYAHWVKAYTHFLAREKRQFLEAAEHAVSINENAAFICGLVGWALAMSGEREKGCELINKAMDLNPYQPTWFNIVSCLTAFENGNFEDAHKFALKFHSPEMPWDGILRSATLGALSRCEDAQTAFDNVVALKPDLAEKRVLREYMSRMIWSDSLVDKLMRAIPIEAWNMRCEDDDGIDDSADHSIKKDRRDRLS